MAERRIQLPAAPIPASTLAAGLAAIRTELSLPAAFPADVVAEGEAGGPGGHPDAAGWLTPGTRTDMLSLPFVTLDPLGSRDLDQAFMIVHPALSGDRAWTLFYAIADVAAHVRPGGAIERESRARGETVYLPDGRVPLHPPGLSEGVASLLPGEDRLAVLWSLEVDAATGELGEIKVGRARIRSDAQLDYAGAEAALAAGKAHPQLELLAELGPLLIGAASRRGAIELPEPSQELVGDPAAGWTLSWLPRSPIEDWNAQLSLLTGRAAARLMLQGRTGLLRTLPPAPPEAAPRLRMAAQALGIDWPADESLSSRLARLDPAEPTHLTLIDQARTLLRGAGYLPLTGTEPAPDDAIHAAVASPYAHVTAPLRRLGDRYATEAAIAASGGVAPPPWVTDALPLLPDLLKASGRRAGSAGRAVVDLAEATVLAGREGEVFDAAVIDVEKGTADIRIQEPPVKARASGPGLVAGTRGDVTLTLADPVRRKVEFKAPPSDAPPA